MIGHQSGYRTVENALVTPPFSTVVKRLVWAVSPRRTAPAQPVAINEDYPARSPPVIEPGVAVRLSEEWLKTRHLGVGQPKPIRNVHRSFLQP